MLRKHAPGRRFRLAPDPRRHHRACLRRGRLQPCRSPRSLRDGRSRLAPIGYRTNHPPSAKRTIRLTPNRAKTYSIDNGTTARDQRAWMLRCTRRNVRNTPEIQRHKPREPSGSKIAHVYRIFTASNSRDGKRSISPIFFSLPWDYVCKCLVKVSAPLRVERQLRRGHFDAFGKASYARSLVRFARASPASQRQKL